MPDMPDKRLPNMGSVYGADARQRAELLTLAVHLFPVTDPLTALLLAQWCETGQVPDA
jgi:hypothetical protein